jgi:hypothetical protein
MEQESWLSAADQIGTWSVPQSRFAIEYSVAVLSEINRAAVDALGALRGGLGIGGVLLGTRDPARINILDFRAVECEYAFGPVFTLSEHDRHTLTELLRNIRQDPGSRSAEVLGWYVSHTRRGGRILAESDLDIYRTFFPESWQVTLLLQPAIMAPTVAGFFFREPDGSIRSSSTYKAFSLGEWQGGEGPAPATRNAPSEPSNSRVVPLRTQSLVLEARVREEDYARKFQPLVAPAADTLHEPPAEPQVRARAVGSTLPAPADLQPSSESNEVADPPKEPPNELRVVARAAGSALAVPVSLQSSSESREAARPSAQPAERGFSSKASARPKWLWFAGVLVVAAAVGWAVNRWLPSRLSGPVALHLSAAERNGLLWIRWDASELVSRRIQGGTLGITDGEARESFSLAAPQVMSGNVWYQPHSDSVDVHLGVKLTDGTVVEGYTNFAAAEAKVIVGDKNDPQSQGVPDAEAARANEELKKVEERNEQLERALKTLQEAQPAAKLPVPQPTSPGRSGAPPATAEATPQVARLGSANGNPNAAGSPLQSMPVVTPPESVLNAPPGVGRSAQTEPKEPQSSARSVTPAPPPRPQTPMSQAPARVTQATAQQGMPPSPAKAPPPILAGYWAYSGASGSPFPPESATLAIVQGTDQLTGTFTGRYRVPKGRKFKSDVQLRFTGPLRPGSQKFAFTAADGNTGEIEILPVAGKPDEIEFVWHSARDGLTFDEVLLRGR